MKLLGYFRSSASFRVRIALNLKGVNAKHVPIHLLRDGGQQNSADYVEINPDGLVPSLIHNEGNQAEIFTQSLAIIEYIDDLFPEPPLLPRAASDRCYVRSVALQIACDIHPLTNLRVLNYLKAEHEVSQEGATTWYRHWLKSGFASLEKKLAREHRVGKLIFGDQPTIADLCLVPQAWNARRFQISLEEFPNIQRVFEYASSLEPFALAAPSMQPDAEPAQTPPMR